MSAENKESYPKTHQAIQLKELGIHNLPLEWI